MRRGVMLAAVIPVLLAFSAVPVVAAPKKVYTGTEGGSCNVVSGANKGKSGTYDSDGDCCGTWGCTECKTRGASNGKCEDGARVGNIHDLLSSLLATQANILAQQEKTTAALTGIRADILDLRILVDDARSACAPPDLVPVPQAGVPPTNFCQTDANNNFFVRVRNQGMSEAAASTLRVTFTTLSGLKTVEVATPVLTWGGGFADLVVAIPEDCFGPWPPETTIGACNFQIAVDAAGVVAESNEPNNNVAGACVPVL